MSKGQVIAGRFEIGDLDKDLVGSGGMGTVYKGWDTRTGQAVAIKSLKPEYVAANPNLVARFVREGKALRQLHHPNIVSMVAAVKETGRHYLVMEYVAGGTLQELLAARGPLPSLRTVEIALDLADALTRAHRLGIIHRDLKPANALMAEDGTPRLTDFGLAYLADGSRLTQSGVTIGTVAYLSPEACEGKVLDERADIWAFGVVLYEMLSGELPFTGQTLGAQLTNILTQPAPALAELRPDVPDALAKLVHRMLEKGHQQRIPSVRLVGAELEAILKGRGSATLSVPAMQPPILDIESPMARPVFVGREREMAQLDQFLRRALAGHGQAVFVLGDAGQGKTALIHEFAWRAQAAHPQLVVATGNCNAHTGIGDPYLPFREILSLLTGDVESLRAAGAVSQGQVERLSHLFPHAMQALVEVGADLVGLFVADTALIRRARAFTQPPIPAERLTRLQELVARKEAIAGNPELQQSTLLEQCTRFLLALASHRPLLLVLDDLQWADGGSTNLLFHLGRRLQSRPILVIGSYRPAEVTTGRDGERHPLETVVNELKRLEGEIQLDLDQAESRQFVEAFVDSEPNHLGEIFRDTLYRQTRGHPLSTIELLREMQQRGDLVQDASGQWVEGPELDWKTLPARLEAVVAERLGRLAEDARELLQIASVEGETFTAEVAARVLDVNERQVLRWLSKLDTEHRLVNAREIQHMNGQRLSRYRFRHILFQEYLYNSLGEAERAYRHEDVGFVLEALYGHKRSEIAIQLARHFQKAGITEKAIGYLSLAGDQARGLYAHDEAIDHYQGALTLLKERQDHEQAARILMKLGLTYHSAFDFQQARQAYEEGFVLWQQAGRRQHMMRQPAVTAPDALKVNWNEPRTLDSTKAWDLYSSCVIDQLFSGLVEYGPEMEVTPDVAQAWEVLQGGLQYVFHLRDDVYWTDGTPLTAGDFAYAWRRVLEPMADSANASLLYEIKGARAFHHGEQPGPGELGLWTPDDRTLVVELERPTGHFPYLLAHHVSFPLPRHIVETHGEAWATAGTLVTNGPFQLMAWQPGQALVLVRNPRYHGSPSGNVERIELSLLSDASTHLQKYKDDELDVFDIGALPPSERDWVRQKYAGDYVSTPSLGTTYAGFDVSRPPFDNLDVRRALILATDREYLTGVVMKGYHFPGTGGLIPPGMPGHSPEIGLPHDPEQARAALTKAGYGAGRGLGPVNLLTFRSLTPYAEGLVSHWRQVLGIEIEWEAVEYGVFVERMNQEPPHMFLSGWTADYPDPDNFLRVSPIRRYTRWQDRTYVELVQAARQVGSQGERLKLYKQADEILVREAVVMPLAYMRRHLLVKQWIKRLPTSPIKHWFWKDVVMEAH